MAQKSLPDELRSAIAMAVVNPGGDGAPRFRPVSQRPRRLVDVLAPKSPLAEMQAQFNRRRSSTVEATAGAIAAESEAIGRLQKQAASWRELTPDGIRSLSADVGALRDRLQAAAGVDEAGEDDIWCATPRARADVARCDRLVWAVEDLEAAAARVTKMVELPSEPAPGVMHRAIDGLVKTAVRCMRVDEASMGLARGAESQRLSASPSRESQPVPPAPRAPPPPPPPPGAGPTAPRWRRFSSSPMDAIIAPEEYRSQHQTAVAQAVAEREAALEQADGATRLVATVVKASAQAALAAARSALVRGLQKHDAYREGHPSKTRSTGVGDQGLIAHTYLITSVSTRDIHLANCRRALDEALRISATVVSPPLWADATPADGRLVRQARLSLQEVELEITRRRSELHENGTADLFTDVRLKEVPPLTPSEQEELEQLRRDRESAGGWGAFDPRVWADADPCLLPADTHVDHGRVVAYEGSEGGSVAEGLKLVKPTDTDVMLRTQFRNGVPNLTAY